ncbi:hypothetical protein RI367_005577 [Sorochytrium milnesiophthora]
MRDKPAASTAAAASRSTTPVPAAMASEEQQLAAKEPPGLTITQSTSLDQVHSLHGSATEINQLVDYEALVAASQAEISADPFPQLVVEPSDGVELQIVRREFKTEKLLPDDYLTEEVQPYMRCILDFLQSDHVTFVNKYGKSAGYDYGTPEDDEAVFESQPALNYDIDDSVEPSSPPTHPMHSAGSEGKSALLRTLSTNTRKSSTTGADTATLMPQDVEASFLQPNYESQTVRTAERSKLFRLSIDHESAERSVPEYRTSKATFQEAPHIDILFECAQLEVRADTAEPFFAAFCLYDISTATRLSENFYCDMNSEELYTSLTDAPAGKMDDATMARKALFKVTVPSPNVFLIVKLSKVLEGDLTEIIDRYLAAKPRSPSTAFKDLYKRLGKYRQPFAFAGVPLFDDDLKCFFGGPQAMTEYTVQQLLPHKQDRMSDTDICAFLNTSQRSNTARKSRTIPCNIVLKLSEVQAGTDAYPRPVLSPHLVRWTSYEHTSDKSAPAAGSGSVVREIEEFKTMDVYETVVHFSNLLYVYPLEINFKKAAIKSRNILCRVQFLDDDKEAQNPVGCERIFGTSRTPNFCTEYYTNVAYHEKCPNLDDEIKIALPFNITKKHHLRFTFYHISCKEGKKDNMMTEIGHAFLPLLAGNLTDAKHELPIALNLIPNYINDRASPEIKWLDSMKECFTVRLRYASTILCQDPYLKTFLMNATDPAISDVDIRSSVTHVVDADVVQLVRYFPVILDNQFLLLCQERTSEDTKAVLFQSILSVVAIVQNESKKARRGSMVYAYVRYRFANPPCEVKPFQALTRQWLLFMRNSHSAKDLLSKAWFLYEIISKSVYFHLHNTEKLNGNMPLDKSLMYPDGFLADLKQLVLEITQEVHRRGMTGLNIGKELNEALGYFLIDIMPYMTKTFMFDLIESHSLSFKAEESTTLCSFKFDFLRTVYGYEHYIPLNLCLQSYFDEPFSKLSSLKKAYLQRHFMSQYLIRETFHYMQRATEENRLRGLFLLRDVVAKHELDARFKEEKCQNRIANLYLPFVMTVANSLNTMKLGDASGSMLIETRSVFVCVLYVLKHMDHELMNRWLQKENMVKVIDLLSNSIDYFGYAGREKIMERLMNAQQQKISTHDAKRYIENHFKSGTTNLREARAQLRQRSMVSRSQITTQTDIQVRPLSDMGGGTIQFQTMRMIRLEGYLASEVSLIAIDVWVALRKLFAANRNNVTNVGVFEKLFNFIVHLLDKPQSEIVLLKTCFVLRDFITEFRADLYKKNTPYCSELARIVVKHANSSIDSVRKAAAGLLYILLRENFRLARSNFTKFRIQLTVCLSKFDITDDYALSRSLACVHEYAKVDNDYDLPIFKQKVHLTSKQLIAILRDSIRMRRMNKNDPEGLADTHHRIADGYMNTPDLRHATLDNLANLHYENGDYPEAAFAVLHSAALVSEYLSSLGNASYVGPKGAKAFLVCSSNLIEESAVHDEKSDEGMYQDAVFTEEGLMKLLERAALLFRKCSMFELVNEVYKLLIPMLEHAHAYSELARVHGILQDTFESISKVAQKNTRIFATYYRVAFYGEKFEEQDGKEYVYKERSVTVLPEICQRLTTCFRSRFGDDFVLLQESGNVDRAQLDPNKAYIQITHVEPYFSETDAQGRTTYYERNTSLRKFVYNTPYTKSGKTHGDVESQYLRKVILQTEKPLPYLKKRVEVVQSEEINLTPIEVSLDAINARCTKLREVINSKPVDIKSLQMVLSGSIRTQVNSGCMEIALVFLSDSKIDRYPPAQTELMRVSFRTFLRLSEVALALNRRLIQSDQLEYQEDLEENFELLKTRLHPLIFGMSTLRTAKSDQEQIKNIVSFIGESDVSAFFN